MKISLRIMRYAFPSSPLASPCSARAAHALLPPTEPFTYASEFQTVSELLVETPLCLPWSILPLKWSIPKIFTRNDTSFTDR